MGIESRLLLCSTEKAEKHRLYWRMPSTTWLITPPFISIPDPYHKPFDWQYRENKVHLELLPLPLTCSNILPLISVSCKLCLLLMHFNFKIIPVSCKKFSKIAKNLETISCYLLSVHVQILIWGLMMSVLLNYFMMRWVLYQISCPRTHHAS